MTTLDPKTVEALTRLAGKPILLSLDAVFVFQLVALLQLALRHPDVKPGSPSAKAAREFIDDFHARVKDREPLVAELVERGNHTEFDE